ncbi:DUF413 domain-containing protein [Thalassotalea fusca]
MDTKIRKGKSLFYGDKVFTRGLSRSSYFNKRESDELMLYGHTMSALYEGTLMPDNPEEVQFVTDMHSEEVSALYPVRLWKKYLAAVEKSKIHHGFANCNGRSNDFVSDNMGFA